MSLTAKSTVYSIGNNSYYNRRNDFS